MYNFLKNDMGKQSHKYSTALSACYNIVRIAILNFNLLLLDIIK